MRRVLVVGGKVAPMAGVDTWSPGRFALVLRNDKLVRLAEPHREPATIAVDDLAGDVQVEVAMRETVEDEGDDPRLHAVEGGRAQSPACRDS